MYKVNFKKLIDKIEELSAHKARTILFRIAAAYHEQDYSEDLENIISLILEENDLIHFND